jgi:hypothetical protein
MLPNVVLKSGDSGMPYHLEPPVTTPLTVIARASPDLSDCGIEEGSSLVTVGRGFRAVCDYPHIRGSVIER